MTCAANGVADTKHVTKNNNIMDKEKETTENTKVNAEEAVNETTQEQQDAQEKQDTTQEETQAAQEETQAEEPAAEPTAEEQIAALTEALEQKKKEHLFLLAEFDNFRKRTLKEKGELIKNGGERVLADLLPVIDDVERAMQSIANSDNIDALREGVNLIYAKFLKYLEQNQVKPIESTGELFDTELHEAVTTFPTDDESMKGHVIDTVQKGYTINDKVLRHAKVVVGQ